MKVFIIFVITALLSACGASSTSSLTGKADPIGSNCPSGFPIKGNATSRTGELIYHVKGGDYYDRTDPEECFSTQQAAEDAGYRKSKR